MNNVIVSGAPRSGTSMVTGILDLCGWYTGGSWQINEGNPKGYFEHLYLKKFLLKPALAHKQLDPLGQIVQWRPKIAIPELKPAWYFEHCPSA